MEIKTTAESKEEYVREWRNYMKPLFSLAMTKDHALWEDVLATLEHLSDLIEKVGEDKFKERTD